MLDQLIGVLWTAFDLILVILGFSLIIVLHELGHFLAAKWAGIRVLAFAVGFGPAALSYRKGLGWRKGSSEAEHHQLLAARAPGAEAISPTEYRLNALPFGGYVKMLGQEDANPAATSTEPDSYTQKPVWKRMVVIAAGVVMNIAVAAVLFVIVFMLGLKTEPPRIGGVERGSPAATAIAENARELGITEPGLKTGDFVRTVDGDKPNSFNDLMVVSAMSRKGRPIELEIDRKDVPRPLVFRIVPEVNRYSKMLQLGVAPAFSGQVATARRAYARKIIAQRLEKTPLAGVRPGMGLTSIDDKPGDFTVHDLNKAVVASAGTPVSAVFSERGLANPGPDVRLEFRGLPEMQAASAVVEDGLELEWNHVLGLAPVMAVEQADEDGGGWKAGLRDGDVFVRVGVVEWPSVPEGRAEIRAHKGDKVRMIVLRRDGDQLREVDLGDVRVGGDGRIGFVMGDTARRSNLVTGWPQGQGTSSAGSGARLDIPRGSRIAKVNGRPVARLDELVALLREQGTPGAALEARLTIQLPLIDKAGAQDIITWSIPSEDLDALRALSWVSPISPALFEPEEFQLQASNPGTAVKMGLRETRRVMLTTYITFARLFQGTVKVEHLKGPVGIAHIGTIIAERGLIWLMFFMALISVNLAVVNFLPIPIADGGHFVFLLYEQVTGRPVSVAVQNIATMAGLALIIGMFLLVTYNDIAQLLGR